jgi:uncharacterized protein involved in outer membrane biogenesis
LPANLTTFRRVLVAISIVLLTPVALLAAAILIVQSPWAERWVAARVGDRIGRTVEVDRIRLGFEWPPAINLGRLRIGNPPWAKTPDLVNAEELHAKVELLPLFEKRLDMPFLRARKATAGLETDGERATWRFDEVPGGQSPF